MKALESAPERAPGAAREAEKGEPMKRRIGCTAVAAAVAGLLLGGFYWAFGAYSDMVRKEVAVHAAWSALESACQRRLDLVRALLDSAVTGPGSGATVVEETREAHARASETVLSPAVLEDPEAIRRFEDRQAEVSAAVARLLASAGADATLRWSQSLDEMRDALADADRRIASVQQELAEAVKAYNAAVRSFPRSAVAAFLRKPQLTSPGIGPAAARDERRQR